MTSRMRCAQFAASLVLAVSLSACGGTPDTTPTSKPEPTETAVIADEDFKLSPLTYQMVSHNGEDCEALSLEYLHSGYTEAPFQLTLYDDGGGLLYMGRTLHGVTYDKDSVHIDGQPAELFVKDGRFALAYGDESLIFTMDGATSGTRQTNSLLVGSYQLKTVKSTNVTQLELDAGGTGTITDPKAKKSAAPQVVHWGNEQIFNRSYICIDSVLYDVSYTRRYSDGTITLTIDDEGQRRFVSIVED